MDLKIYGPNWLLCRDIESSIAIESLVFVVAFVATCNFSVAIGSLSFFLDSVTTDFDNVVT